VTLRLLVLEKQTGNVQPIAIREVIYSLITRTLPIQLKNTFVEYFNPHQFKVATLGGCEIMVHGVKVILDLHFNWVVL
jgi:hypothetical protein